MRSRTLHVVALLLAVVAVGSTASAARSAGHSEKQLRVLNRLIAAAINDYRVAHRLPPLHVSPSLNASARQHSKEMGLDGYFDHPSADGTAFWKRIQKYYTSTSYTYWTVGENLLWSTPPLSADDAMRMWISSPPHRANLKNRNWTDVGVSAVQVTHAGGVYGGSNVVIITTDFGARH